MSELNKLSERQREIVGLPLGPISVTACAGSGKTKTAVHRVAKIRRELVDPHGLVALLSFSNVAVDTFRRDYAALSRSGETAGALDRVEIDTVDGFITANILRPHGHLVMKCDCVPYLVSGAEPFTKGFTVFDGTHRQPTTKLEIRVAGNKFEYGIPQRNATKTVAAGDAIKSLAVLAKIGAYTHSHGRYWAFKTLANSPLVLRAMARRYPQILIDEAQDIGPEQQLILEMLIKAGSTVSLIGDANQGIYEFDGANGDFLREYSKRADVTSKELETNFRSVPPLVTIANALTGRKDDWDRVAPAGTHGACFIPYKDAEREKTLDTFRQLLTAATIDVSDAVVLCRAGPKVVEWAGGGSEQGLGAVGHLVDAVVARDQLKRLDLAYDCLCRAIVGLVADEHRDLCARLMAVGRIEERKLRQDIFAFLRDETNGLPSGTLVANAGWHAALVPRTKAFIAKLCADHGLKPAATIGNRLTKRDLTASPLVAAPDLARADARPLRFSTVHKVKGESIGGVMYVVSKAHLDAMLDGPKTEVGRIGYVALTRAKNLFVLAVPENCLKDYEGALTALGFWKPGGGGAVAAVKAAEGTGAPNDGVEEADPSSVFD